MKKNILDIKQEILKNRLKEILSKNPKKVAKILSFLIKRQKNV